MGESRSGASSWSFGRFKVVSASTEHTEDRCAKPADQVGLLGSRQVPARSATGRGGADRHGSSARTRVCDATLLRNGSNRTTATSKCKGKDACGDGRDWLALVISSACHCDRGGLQLLRLPGSLAENGMAAGIMLHFRRPC